MCIQIKVPNLEMSNEESLMVILGAHVLYEKNNKNNTQMWGFSHDYDAHKSWFILVWKWIRRLQMSTFGAHLGINIPRVLWKCNPKPKE